MQQRRTSAPRSYPCRGFQWTAATNVDKQTAATAGSIAAHRGPTLDIAAQPATSCMAVMGIRLPTPQVLLAAAYHQLTRHRRSIVLRENA